MNHSCALAPARQIPDGGHRLAFRRGLRWAVLLQGLLLVLARPMPAVSAADASAAFDAANRLYEEGRYREAIDAYQAIGTNTPFAALHFNLGNAFYQAGQPGQAIAEYQVAQALAPRDRDVAANLRFLRSTVSGPTWKPHWTEKLVRRLTATDWRRATTVAVWLCFGLLAIAQVRPAWRAHVRRPISGTALLTVVFLGMTLWNEFSLGSRRLAVVVEPEAVVRLGPFDASPAALTVKDGAELLLVDQKDDWFQVTADGHTSGWVRADTLRGLW